MRLLLLSNSTMPGEEYLSYPTPYISDFLNTSVRSAVFIPYAGVTISWDDYTQRVRARFSQLGYSLTSVHEATNPAQAIADAETIVIGGGNTWQLLSLLQKNGLIDIIRTKVKGGTPYIGWSAGSNVACLSIKTTNDMPIVEPESFTALRLANFQINPHYIDANPQGHAGETRQQRIEEFLVANPDVTVVGLREGSMLRIEDDTIQLLGSTNARVFRNKQAPVEYKSGSTFDFLTTVTA